MNQTEPNSGLILEQGSTNKSSTDQARETALGTATDASHDDEWEDLTPGHVATLDLKFVSGNDKATNESTKQKFSVFDSNKSLLGMVEQLRFEPPSNLGPTESVTERAKELFTMSEEDAEDKEGDIVDTEGIVDKVDSGVQVVKEKLAHAKDQGASAIETVKDQGSSAIEKAIDYNVPSSIAGQPSATDKPVTERLKETSASSARSVQEQFEKTKEAGTEAFRKTNEEIRDTNECQSTDSGIENAAGPTGGDDKRSDDTLSGKVMEKVDMGIHTVKDQVKKAAEQGKTLAQEAKELAMPSPTVSEKSHEHGDIMAPDKTNSLGGNLLDKVDTGIHTVKEQVERAKEQGTSLAEVVESKAADAVASAKGKSTDAGHKATENRENASVDDGETLSERVANTVESGVDAVKEKAAQLTASVKDTFQSTSSHMEEEKAHKTGMEANKGDFESKSNLPIDDDAAQANLQHESAVGPDLESAIVPDEALVNKETVLGELKTAEGVTKAESSDSPQDISTDTDEADHPDTEVASPDKKKKKRKRNKKKKKLKEMFHELPSLEPTVSEMPSMRMVTEKSLSSGALNTPH